MAAWKRLRWVTQPVTKSSNEPTMRSLAPEYHHETHGTYVNALRQALDGTIQARNIALTGPYGVGKSSILQQIVDVYPKRVVEISLSALGGVSAEANANSGPTGDSAMDAASTTNLIQKEIVKQLLYRELPAKARQSRFNRISRPGKLREVVDALVFSLVALTVLYLAGWDQAIMHRVGVAAPSSPAWSRYVLLFMLACAGWLAVRFRMRGSIVVEKLTAGPATLTLSSQRGSYFDDYLDEIVYFFEVSKRDIVIFEDIDRFDDTGIFETLRALNVLLNRAGQLSGRDVTFIYAVKDSLFEALGNDPINREEAQVELQRANRTKFFDLVVPVVPFITHQNARDLMSETMQSPNWVVSAALVSLVASHVADMRLIINIRNEFEIYHRQLLNNPNAVPDLTDDKLFALVVYKNIYMLDFEEIRHRVSRLDSLYSNWRLLVQMNVERLTEERTILRKRQEGELSRSERSAAWGELLERFSELIGRAVSGHAGRRAVVEVNGRAVDSDEMRSPGFWEDVIANRHSVTVQPGSRQSSNRLEFQFSDLSDILGQAIDPVLWEKVDRDESEQSLARIEGRLTFLHHHSWQELWARPEFRGKPKSDDSRGATFRALVKQHLTPGLPCDLVSNGYIDQYFMLYVSSFYGRHIRKDALQYVLRNIDPGVPDPLYELTADDVRAIIEDKGPAVLRNPGMYNVSVFDHLLELGDSGEFDELVSQLLLLGQPEYDFIDRYVVHGRSPTELIRRMTPKWTEIFSYLTSSALLDEDNRQKLFDTALASSTADSTYNLDESIRTYIESNYESFASLTEPTSAADANAAVALCSKAGAMLNSVVALAPEAREAVADERVYATTAENLALLSGGDDIALDQLRTRCMRVYEHAINDLDDYIRSVKESSATKFTISSPDEFISVLNDMPETGPFKTLIRLSSPACQVDVLGSVPSKFWPTLASEGRIPATFANVAAYADSFDGIDEPLARLLTEEAKISEVPSEDLKGRRAVAITLVNGSTFLNDVKLRVSLAQGLNLTEPLSLSNVKPQSGPLIGRLIEAGLLADAVGSLQNTHMLDWPTREAAIAASRAYPEFMEPSLLPVGEVGRLFGSRKIDDVVKKKVLADLSAYTPGATPDVFAAIGLEAQRKKWRLDYAQISALMAGGLTDGAVAVGLIVNAGSSISISEVHQFLGQLVGDYPKLADRGRRHAVVPDDSVHHQLLVRLQEEGHVSKFRREKRASGSVLRVYMKHK